MIWSNCFGQIGAESPMGICTYSIRSSRGVTSPGQSDTTVLMPKGLAEARRLASSNDPTLSLCQIFVIMRLLFFSVPLQRAGLFDLSVSPLALHSTPDHPENQHAADMFSLRLPAEP